MNTRTLITTVIAPQLASVDGEVIDVHIELASMECDASLWGATYQRAVALLAAHSLTITERNAESGTAGAGSGAVTSRKAGDLSITYGAALGVISSDATYATTSYGLEFLRLRQQLGSMAFVAGR